VERDVQFVDADQGTSQRPTVRWPDSRVYLDVTVTLVTAVGGLHAF
jgi:hypothetical protein